MDAQQTDLLDDLCRGYRLFAALGWGDTGDGHISARDPNRTDHFWLLRYGVPFSDASIERLVLLDPGGTVVEGEGNVNSPAFRIHHPLLTARSDLVAIAHTHTPWGTPFSAELRPIQPITQEACFFFEDCAMFDDEEVQIQDMAGGERIAQCIGKNHSIILRNHGLVTAGTSVASAICRFVLLERVCEAHLKARKATPINSAAARYAKSDLTRPTAFDNMFQYLTKHHGVY
ncbi:MAG: ribulose phosphate epimerase [Gammaproteobacteria bacterium]|nr:ribulose phosphate epimerase [Gammaproteobacteria bacterium]MYD79531.1 ribulose phosphate epimerase [Gammaproteobacteria bacterium]